MHIQNAVSTVIIITTVFVKNGSQIPFNKRFYSRKLPPEGKYREFSNNPAMLFLFTVLKKIAGVAKHVIRTLL